MHPHFATPESGAVGGNAVTSHSDDRRRFVTRSARRTPAPTVPTAARPLAAEREYLKLARDEHDRRVTDAIATLDARITAPPPPSPVASPVQVGTVERFVDAYGDSRVGFRYHGVGGRDVFVVLPAELEDAEAESEIRQFISRRLAHAHLRETGK